MPTVKVHLLVHTSGSNDDELMANAERWLQRLLEMYVDRRLWDDIEAVEVEKE